ncbi:hypothetical protein B484DRAFT_216367 [Ochromonadaceae sp. CCMP2298]|nr:hypothetical protein B484DRAFT_216367 [Ochromonadaceae sp. CCMP2298]
MFTRAALDPLVCRIGGKGGRYYEPKRVREERSRLEKEEAEEMAEAEAEEALEAGAGTVGAEGAEVGTEEAEGAEVGAGRDVEGTEVEAYDNLKVDSYNTYELSALELHLITGEQPEAVQQALGASLDALCPPLASSKTLQHKALRVVFSVGVDVCIIDAEASAKLGRLSLTSEDMLTSDETDQVFEHFYLPSHLDGESSPLS